MFGKYASNIFKKVVKNGVNNSNTRALSVVFDLSIPPTTVFLPQNLSDNRLVTPYDMQGNYAQHQTQKQYALVNKHKNLTESKIKELIDSAAEEVNFSLNLEVKMPKTPELELRLGDMVTQLQTIDYSSLRLDKLFVSAKDYSCLNWNQGNLTKLGLNPEIIHKLDILLKTIAKLNENKERQTQKDALGAFLKVMDILSPLIPLHRINVVGRREPLDQLHSDFNELLKVPFLVHKDDIMLTLGLALSTNDSTIEQSQPPESIAIETITEETTTLPPRMPPANTHHDDIDLSQALVPTRQSINQEMVSWLAGDQFGAISIMANGNNVGIYLDQNTINALRNLLQPDNHSRSTFVRVSYFNQQGDYITGSVRVTSAMLAQLFNRYGTRQRQSRATAAIESQEALQQHPQVEVLDDTLHTAMPRESSPELPRSLNSNNPADFIIETGHPDNLSNFAQNPPESSTDNLTTREDRENQSNTDENIDNQSTDFSWLETTMRLAGKVFSAFVVGAAICYSLKPKADNSLSTIDYGDSDAVSLHVNGFDVDGMTTSLYTPSSAPYHFNLSQTAAGDDTKFQYLEVTDHDKYCDVMTGDFYPTQQDLIFSEPYFSNATIIDTTPGLSANLWDTAKDENTGELATKATKNNESHMQQNADSMALEPVTTHTNKYCVTQALNIPYYLFQRDAQFAFRPQKSALSSIQIIPAANEANSLVVYQGLVPYLATYTDDASKSVIFNDDSGALSISSPAKNQNIEYCRVSFSSNHGEEIVLFIEQRYLILCADFFKKFIQEPNSASLTLTDNTQKMVLRQNQNTVEINYQTSTGNVLHWSGIYPNQQLQMLAWHAMSAAAQNQIDLSQSASLPELAFQSTANIFIPFNSLPLSHNRITCLSTIPASIRFTCPAIQTSLLQIAAPRSENFTVYNDTVNIERSSQTTSKETNDANLQTDEIILKNNILPEQFSQWLNYCYGASSVLALIALYQVLKLQQDYSQSDSRNHHKNVEPHSLNLDSDEDNEECDENYLLDPDPNWNFAALANEIAILKDEIARLRKRQPRNIIHPVQDPNYTETINKLSDRISALIQRLNQKNATVNPSSNRKSDKDKILNELESLRRQLKLEKQQIATVKINNISRKNKKLANIKTRKTKHRTYSEDGDTSNEELDNHIDNLSSDKKVKPSLKSAKKSSGNGGNSISNIATPSEVALEISGGKSKFSDLSKSAAATSYGIFANINQGRKAIDDPVRNLYSRDNLFSEASIIGEDQYLLKINYPEKQVLIPKQHQALINNGLEVSSSTGIPYTLIHKKDSEPCAILKKADAEKEANESEDEHYQRLAMTVMNMIDNVATKSLKMDINTNDPFVKIIAQQYLAFLNKQEGIHFKPTFNNSCPIDNSKEQAAVNCFEKLVTQRKADIINNNPAIAEIKAFQANPSIDLTDEEEVEEDDEISTLRKSNTL